MGVVPPALAEAAIIGPESELIRRVEIYEADGLTRWLNGDNDDRLLGGSVTIDYSRDERRSLDLTLDNSDFALKHMPTGFWYDKVFKVFCGVRYTAPLGTTSTSTRTNYWTNSRYATAGTPYAARVNLFTDPTLTLDATANGTADAWNLYNPSGTCVGTATLSGGVQTLTITSIPAGSGNRMGFYVDIPVTASSTQKRTISIDYTMTGATNDRFTLYGMLLDSANAGVAGTPVSVVTTADGGRPAVTVPADINGVKLRMYCWVDTSDSLANSATITLTLKRPLMEESGIELPYFDINTPPKERYNYHINSLCTQTSVQGWYSNNGTVYTAARDSTRGTPYGQYCMSWTRTSSSPNTTALSGYSYNSTSLYGWKCNSGDSVSVSMLMSTDAPNRRGYFYLAFVDASNTVLTLDIAGATKYPLAPGGWTEVSRTQVAPANAQAFYPVYILESSDGSIIPTGEVNYTTAFLIERTPYKRPFFHPSIAAPSGFTAAWDGTANASPTYLYQSDPTRAWAGTANASSTNLMFTPPANTTGKYTTFSNTLRCTQDASALAPYSARVWYYGNPAGAGALSHYQTTTITGRAPGELWAGRYRARVVQSNGRDLAISFRVAAYSTTTYLDSTTGTAFVTLPQDGRWVDVDLPCTQVTPAGTTQMRYLVYAWAGSGSSISENECWEIEAVTLENSAHSDGYFNGSIAAFANRTFAWSGTVDNSFSTETRTITDYTPTSTTWETQVGEFMIDSISEDHFPYVVKVNGRDYTKKCLVAKFTQATSFPSGQAIETTIKTIATNAGISKFLLPVTGKTLGKDYIFERGTTRWEAMKGIADGFGYELFFDAQGYLVMREYLDPVTAPLAYTLETGTYGNLVTYSKTVNDTRIYNHIVVTGESQDSSVIPVSAEAKNTEPSSPTRIAAIGDRVYQYSSSFITTVTQAQDVANKFLQLHALEEFDLNFSAIALPWLEVGEIVEFDDPRPNPGQPTRFLLSSLTLPLDLGAMSGNAKRVSVVG